MGHAGMMPGMMPMMGQPGMMMMAPPQGMMLAPGQPMPGPGQQMFVVRPMMMAQGGMGMPPQMMMAPPQGMVGSPGRPGMVMPPQVRVCSRAGHSTECCVDQRVQRAPFLP